MLLYDRNWYYVSNGQMAADMDFNSPGLPTPKKGQVLRLTNTNWDGETSYRTSDGQWHECIGAALTHARKNNL